MSIHCVNKCIHQSEGYCILQELPLNTQNIATDIDCQYYKPMN